MINRGDVFYVTSGHTESGSEQRAGRPAVVVSNNLNNIHSDVVEIVYLTTAHKTDLPTHCQILSTQRTCTALCEQVISVNVDRLDRYMTSVTADELANIDRCLHVSLGLTPQLSQRECEVLNTLLSAEIMKQHLQYDTTSPLLQTMCSLRDKLVVSNR